MLHQETTSTKPEPLPVTYVQATTMSIDPLLYYPLPASIDLGGRFTNWPSAKVSYCLVYIFGAGSRRPWLKPVTFRKIQARRSWPSTQQSPEFNHTNTAEQSTLLLWDNMFKMLLLWGGRSWLHIVQSTLTANRDRLLCKGLNLVLIFWRKYVNKQIHKLNNGVCTNWRLKRKVGLWI